MIWNKKNIIDFLEEWKKYKCDEFVENRSQAQNRLYHGRLSDISRSLLREKWACIWVTDLHEWLKEKFISTRYKFNKLTKKRYKQEKTTTTLNKKQFSQYLKDIDWYLWQMFELIVPKATEFSLYETYN